MAHTVEKASPRIGQGIALVAAILLVLAFFLAAGQALNTSLEVQVRPAGARVRLLEPVVDGKQLEKGANTGIARFEKLPGGSTARVLVRAKGFKDGVGQALLPAAGGHVVMQIHLEEETGQLLVETEPPGSQIFLDNSPRGRAPQVLNVPPGHYSVSTRRAGFKLAEQAVEVKADDSIKVLLVMEKAEATDLPDAAPVAVVEDKPPPPGYGYVMMKSSHNSTFIVDNQLAGTGIQMRRVVREGPHIIGCRAHKKGSETRRIEVIEGETIVVEFEFEDDTVARAKSATDPNTALYWHVRAGSTRNSGKYGDSVDMFNKALEIDPDFYPAHRQLGYTLPALKRWDEAIEHWETYLDLNPHAADKEKIDSLILQVQRIQDKEAKGEKWEMAEILNDPGIGFRK